MVAGIGMGTMQRSKRITRSRSESSTSIMASMLMGTTMTMAASTSALTPMTVITTAAMTMTIRTIAVMITGTTMGTAPAMRIAELTALLHLASPALPVGAFSYSQGLESAIDAQWVVDERSTSEWIAGGLANVLARCELPFVSHQIARWHTHDTPSIAALATADAQFLASRESAELRRETEQMGWSLKQLCLSLEWGESARRETLSALAPLAQPSAFAFAVAAHSIDTQAALAAYAFSWIENQVAAALKAVPLGQMAGQRIVVSLRTAIEAAVERAMATPPDAINTFAPMLGVLSARHELQYSRLFRS